MLQGEEEMRTKSWCVAILDDIIWSMSSDCDSLKLETVKNSLKPLLKSSYALISVKK